MVGRFEPGPCREDVDNVLDNGPYDNVCLASAVVSELDWRTALVRKCVVDRTPAETLFFFFFF